MVIKMWFRRDFQGISRGTGVKKLSKYVDVIYGWPFMCGVLLKSIAVLLFMCNAAEV